jgi:hypothetical protein
MGYLPRIRSAKEYFAHGSVPYDGTAPRSGRLATVWRRFCEVAETIAAYHAAAAMYEDLARLSDAELHRRGLSRARLARDVIAAHERVQGWGRVWRS